MNTYPFQLINYIIITIILYYIIITINIYIYIYTTYKYILYYYYYYSYPFRAPAADARAPRRATRLYNVRMHLSNTKIKNKLKKINKQEKKQQIKK